MKKLKSKSGFTLIEMMVTIAILVMLVVGIDTGMNSGMRIYNDSIFHAHTSSLDEILSTSMGDILRYSENIQPYGIEVNSSHYMFTNYEYGAVDAGFNLSPDGIVVLKNHVNQNSAEPEPESATEPVSTDIELFSKGAYPDLKVTDLNVDFTHHKEPQPEDATEIRGNYFTVTYTISNVSNTKSRDFTHVIRVLNPPAQEAGA